MKITIINPNKNEKRYAREELDEFDAMSKSQQPILKYLISKHDIKFRPPYGRVMEERQRFASFIATTNNRRPLTDPTGSRRFICVYADEIDNSGLINYDMLYAQLYTELEQGRHITRIVCGFLPAGRRIQGRHILYDFCEGVKAVWQTGFKP